MTSRRMLFPALLLAHLAVMLVLVRVPKAARVAVPDSALMVFSVPERPVVAATVPPPFTADVVAAVDAPDFAVSPAPSTRAGGACGLTDEIQTALSDSASVLDAVDQIPATARSVSNSLLLWDGSWAEARTLGGAAALIPIQTVVQAQIRAASPRCMQEDIAGPRLMLVHGAEGVVVLAFGSGVWRWEQLLQ